MLTDFLDKNGKYELTEDQIGELELGCDEVIRVVNDDVNNWEDSKDKHLEVVISYKYIERTGMYRLTSSHLSRFTPKRHDG